MGYGNAFGSVAPTGYGGGYGYNTYGNMLDGGASGAGIYGRFGGLGQLPYGGYGSGGYYGSMPNYGSGLYSPYGYGGGGGYGYGGGMMRADPFNRNGQLGGFYGPQNLALQYPILGTGNPQQSLYSPNYWGGVLSPLKTAKTAKKQKMFLE